MIEPGTFANEMGGISSWLEISNFKNTAFVSIAYSYFCVLCFICFLFLVL